jgi:hypothetical protein
MLRTAPAGGNRNYVIDIQAFRRSTFHTLSTVALPDE